jgi:hypothetical protein
VHRDNLGKYELCRFSSKSHSEEYVGFRVVQSIHGLIPMRPRDYIHNDAMVNHHGTTQYSLKTGLKKIKGVGEEAVPKKLKQLHMRDTFKPQDATQLIDEHKKGALKSLMFHKEKHDGSGKRRACADRRNQQEKATPGNTASPTISLESVLITSVIDAYEGRLVSVFDVPGEFLSYDMDK